MSRLTKESVLGPRCGDWRSVTGDIDIEADQIGIGKTTDTHLQGLPL